MITITFPVPPGKRVSIINSTQACVELTERADDILVEITNSPGPVDMAVHTEPLASNMTMGQAGDDKGISLLKHAADIERMIREEEAGPFAEESER